MASMEGDDVEEIEAEPDLSNQNPAFLVQLYRTGIFFLQSYGWYVLFGIIILLFIKSKLDKPLQKWRKKREQDQEYTNYDPDVAQQKQESMEMARRRLQEQYDQQAARFAEEQKKKEEEKRKAKIEDWDRHQKGQGYRSKYRVTEGEESTSASKPKKKPVYRSDDYSPLMGSGGGGACYRPSSRGGDAGGG